MTSRNPAQCATCIRWIPGIRNNGVQTCAAFPDVIPDDVWWNRVDHREPIEGDNGLQWAPRKEGVEYPEWVLEPPEAPR